MNKLYIFKMSYSLRSQQFY